MFTLRDFSSGPSRFVIFASSVPNSHVKHAVFNSECWDINCIQINVDLLSLPYSRLKLLFISEHKKLALVMHYSPDESVKNFKLQMYLCCLWPDITYLMLLGEKPVLVSIYLPHFYEIYVPTLCLVLSSDIMYFGIMLVHFQEEMLICDACDKGYHMNCHNPPVPEKPTG